MRTILVAGGSATQLGDGTVRFNPPAGSPAGWLPDFVGSVPVWKPGRLPDAGAGGTEDFQVDRVDFGHGYSQRAPKGLNAVQDQVPLTFSMLDAQRAEAILSFLRQRQGAQAFLWALPGEAHRLWTCGRASRAQSQGTFWTVSAQLRREYDPLP